MYHKYSRQGDNSDNHLVAYACQGTNVGEAGALRSGNGHLTGGVPLVASTQRARHDSSYTGDGAPGVPLVVSALVSNGDAHSGYREERGLVPTRALQYADQLGREKRQNGMGIGDEDDPMYTLETRQAHGVLTPCAVRRLTPRECERLQGFPDDWTLVPYRGKPAADGNRYRALGNSFAVPVVAWIGRRIQMVEDVA